MLNNALNGEALDENISYETLNYEMLNKVLNIEFDEEIKKKLEMLVINMEDYVYDALHYKMPNKQQLNTLIELNKDLGLLEKEFDNCAEDAIHKIECDTFDDSLSYKQFTDDERILITALLIAQPGNKEFFEAYKFKYLPRKKEAILNINNKYNLFTYKIDFMGDTFLKNLLGIKNKIDKIIGRKSDQILDIERADIIERKEQYWEALVEAEYMEIEERISKHLPTIAPNVFVKYLVTQYRNWEKDYHFFDRIYHHNYRIHYEIS